jgi:hypothetical protein
MTSKSSDRIPGSDSSTGGVSRFQDYLYDIAGIILYALAAMTLLAILVPGLGDGALGWWVGTLQTWFGWGSIWVVILSLIHI